LLTNTILKISIFSRSRTRAALEAEKMLALRAIKELEFDRAMGKVSDEDFADMSLRLRARAVRVLQQLDQAGVAQRARIERELDARLGTRPAGPGPASAAPASAVASATPDEAGDEAGEDEGRRSCAACDTENDRDARFCKQCGGPLL
jgi:hypothetical protein